MIGIILTPAKPLSEEAKAKLDRMMKARDERIKRITRELREKYGNNTAR